MSKTIRVNEYYDLFDVKITRDDPYKAATVANITNTNIPNDIKPTNEYNVFRGFSNWDNFYDNNKTLTTPPATYTANNVIEITGKHKSPQANSSIKVDTNGDIWCYPPNVSVPYWSRIVFRNFDYTIQPSPFSKYYNLLETSDSISIDPTDADFSITGKLVSDNNEYTYDNVKIGTGNFIYGSIDTFKYAPLFLKFDEYPSRSKVIFSRCDKTRNPDIEHRFSYHKGQMEPIKLNLSLSAGITNNDISTGNKYNVNLNKEEIEELLSKCYWCIEWISNIDDGN